jgi:hypothetical protein
MTLVMDVFTVALADEERRLVPREMIKRLRTEAVTWLLSAAVFLVSALPVLDKVYVDGTYPRTDLWVGALVVVRIRRSARSVLEEQPR